MVEIQIKDANSQWVTIRTESFMSYAGTFTRIVLWQEIGENVPTRLRISTTGGAKNLVREGKIESTDVVVPGVRTDRSPSANFPAL